jgi:UDP-sulfoquinovose synthase
LWQFYQKNDQLRITDLHQGIVWGTSTPQTILEHLINRFDYDGDYGTVLNRFLLQGTMGVPLTVYGTSGQTRAFIHISDTARCIEITINNSPAKRDRVEIFNQIAKTHRVRDIAEMVATMTGVEAKCIPTLVKTRLKMNWTMLRFEIYSESSSQPVLAFVEMRAV